MSAMANIASCPPAQTPDSSSFSTLRDLLLALSLTILAALAMQASGVQTPQAAGTAPLVQDWKGNSGTLGAIS